MSEFEVIFKERLCDARGCENYVTHWAQPKGYVGPVYCIGHEYLAKYSCPNGQCQS